MADDEQKNESAADPWADIMADGPGEPLAEGSFSFDEEVPAPAAAEPVPPAAAAEPESAAAAAEPADEVVDAWLTDADLAPEPADPAAAEELAAGSSSVQIGTGQSGIVAEGDEDAWDDAEATPEPEASESAGDAAALAGAAAGSKPQAAKPQPAKPRKQKKPQSAFGQIVGIVLGGAMAFPITFAILIWGLQKDPFKVTKYVPENLAFLLPQKFQPGFKKGGAATPPAKTPDEVAAIQAAAEPEPGGEEMPPNEPDASLVDDAAAARPVDDEPAVAAHPAEPAAPPPLDTGTLEIAVGDATAAIDAFESLADPGDSSRKRLLVDLYKALSRVAAESVMLEHVAADAGRPLAEPPRQLDDLHGRLRPHQEELVRLGRNWLDFGKRPSDGIVLPVTFVSARRVGPYWSSRVTLALPKGGTRELAVISRAEPAAVAGDGVILTGMLFDGDVIWAADVRPLAPAYGGF